jgi:two-component system, chemotaxis family, sensor kinase Cph1
VKTLRHAPSAPDGQPDVQQLLRRLIAAQDDERTRLARELHDQLGQQLTALRLVLERHQAECRVDSRAAIDKALSLAREIDAEVDALAWQLRPGVVDDLGLAASLRQLVRRWAYYAPVGAECHCEIAPGQLSREAEVTVYRVAQEALHNVLKHAHATHVNVLAGIRSGSVALLVQDDGVGFDLSKGCDAAEGMGLRGMRERAALVGGTLEVGSAPGRGCMVSLRIPVATTQDRSAASARQCRRVKTVSSRSGGIES